jgi:glycosyltransferase involved in cell wall biosynthesis
VKILVVSQAFPPYNASGVVRVGKLVSFLIDRGHDVRVLTASPLPYPRTLPVDVPSDRIVTTQSADPFAFLARRRAAQRARDDSAGQSLVGTGWRGKILRWVGAMVAIPEPQIAWYPYAVAGGARLMKEWTPDVVYASALPFTAHVVAARLARKVSVPWVAEFRDHFAGNPYSNLPAWRDPIDSWIERRVLASVSACVTVSQPMAATLRARHSKPTLVVLNGFDRHAAPASPAHPDAHAPLRIVYTGVIYPGRRDPSPLFAAIAMLGDGAQNVTVDFYGQDLRTVNELAQRYGVSEQVHLRGPIAHIDSLAQQQTADVLLLLLGSDPREVGVYTGKLFEYIGSGRPILAVGGSKGVAAEMIRSRGLGVVASDPEAIAGALRRWSDEKRATGAIVAAPREGKVGLSRDEQFDKVDDLLRQLVEKRAESRLPSPAPLSAL